ncbi:hypothetical protein FRB99_007645 [Tulasnella sp. 403]|nr:hypothetical protein FRB99_007645 [Tulasnella sp. 403]
MPRPTLPPADRMMSAPVSSLAQPVASRPTTADFGVQRFLMGVHARSVSGGTPVPASTPPIKMSSARPLDVLASLHKSAPGLVKTRQGSVLSRGFILKTDHYESGRAMHLDIDLQGAPNFRQNKSAMNVFGVAQPRVGGFKAILSLLQCRPNLPVQSRCYWFSTREEAIVYISGRPFVLRDSSAPRDSITLTDRAENLEAIEKRLKADILAEAAKFGGLILTHHELDNDEIIPTWTAVDSTTVKTQREVIEEMKTEGWSVVYHRIPITRDHPIEDNYIDAFVNIIKDTDPFETPLVFSCGMGAVRTTFAMVGACITRRRQFILYGAPDPYESTKMPLPSSGIATPKAVATLEQVNLQQELNKSLLRITHILQQGLHGQDSRSAIELLMSQPSLLESLRRAHSGAYSVVLSLLGCLDHGTTAKKLVDRVIDDCNHVADLREDVLVHRIRYSLTNMDDKTRGSHLAKATKALERYFFIIAFTSYVEDQGKWDIGFSDWLKARVEIWNQVLYLRRSEGLKIFAPVSDLSAISKVEAARKHELTVGGGQLLGDEWTEHVVKNRSGIILREGTLLKSDLWRGESRKVASGVRGAINFRNVPGTNIYCLGQPTNDAIESVLRRVIEAHPQAEQVVWIALREEPIVYVNGYPYCLRSEASTLRNMKDYGGISASRLEILEDRLKGDVIAELRNFGQRLLLHTETSDAAVVPVWEEVEDSQVDVLKEVMRQHTLPNDVPLQYHRIPITSETPPDFSDISELMDVVINTSLERSAIVVNCQLGRGRSTLASILVLLIQRWLQASGSVSVPTTPFRRTMSRFSLSDWEPEATTRNTTPRPSYQVINNVLRVVRHGLRVKEAVDDAIDLCGDVFNLRDSIETFRISAEQATDPRQKRMYIQRAKQSLRRYFQLVIFQAYLQSTPPDIIRTVESFETYVKNRPVFKTFEHEMDADNSTSLKLLERMDVSEGMAFPDEIAQTVANRSGTVLSASTILKSDFFSNLQKMSLPERIEGAANFREVPLVIALPEELWAPLSGVNNAKNITVAGTGMPQTEGATGITTDVVESMENTLKRDVQREIRQNNGRILLHDEVEESPGQFTITAQWEKLDESDVMTPRDLFDMLVSEGYQVDYTRVAITDEQAPLPAALGQLVQRVTTALHDGDVIIQNCQMGRGRTTTGMIVSCLIATIYSYDVVEGFLDNDSPPDGASPDISHFLFETQEGSEEKAYLQGEYKTILQLVGVLSHGKAAKRLTDMAIDQMDGVQNLRKAVFEYVSALFTGFVPNYSIAYSYKVKIAACQPGSSKHKMLTDLGINYLFRYGTLIVLSNYLIERRAAETEEEDFSEWLKAHREIKTLLGRRSLD